MLDGAALGTLMIGLDSARETYEWSEPRVGRSAPRRRLVRSTVRIGLAIVLRRAADRLDHRPAAGLASSASGA